MEHSGKVTADHLRRDAYLYVRQSSLKQVVNNRESTQRQYALRGRAVALGWEESRIVVIDSDQGRSGASTAGRDGFQHLVAEVSMGRAGIVLGLEVSRLASLPPTTPTPAGPPSATPSGTGSSCT
jgi:DNA invertase Pin-like site-specific DNA recombinase